MQIFEMFSDQFVLAIFCGCFIQVMTIFVLFKTALGLNQIDFAIVTFILSLVISAAFVQHKFDLDLDKQATLKSRLASFMADHSDPKIKAKLPAILGSAESGLDDQKNFFAIQTVYLLSQFKSAIAIALVLIIPLFLIDFLVAVALTLAGIQNLAVSTIAIPLKLLLLATVEAWDMLLSKLLTGFI